MNMENVRQMDYSCRSNECRLNHASVQLSFQTATEHHACVILVLHSYKLVNVVHLTWQVAAQLPRALIPRQSGTFSKSTEYPF